MKLIIVGATGFVGKELLRQSVARNDITSVVAVSRRPLPTESGSDKVKNVVIKDYDQYDDEARSAFVGANGCIWTIAITPSKSAQYAKEEVYRICHTSTMVGLKEMYASGLGKPFRYIYMSGIAAERDQTKTPSFKPEYSLMRGETENQVLAFAASKGSDIEATVAKPGLITDGSVAKYVMSTGLKWVMGVPSISNEVICKAMLDQVVNGIEKDPLVNDELIRIAEGVE